MPIKPENAALYPPDWSKISLTVRQRAGWACEFCKISNYAVGYRERNGRFHPLCGSGPCDAAGDGKHWPGLEPISYREAREFAATSNTEGERDADGHRWFVIVLTVAHLDHNPANCTPENLKALCQWCHLHYDLEHHVESAYQTRRAGKATGDLFP